MMVKSDGTYVALIRFELPDGLIGRTIHTATLELRTIHRDKPGLFCWVGAHRLRRPWVAEQATWMQAARNQPWSSPGAAGAEDSDPNSLDVRQVSTVDAWYSLDVTAAVRDWAANPGSNHGLLLKGSSPTAVTYKFAQSEHTTQGYRPKLVISYSEAAAATQIAVGAHRTKWRLDLWPWNYYCRRCPE